jgi:hypothetical protein
VVSAASRANPHNAALAAEVQTTFQGTTLRGLLLEAYAFGTIGQVAFVAALISFSLAFVMLILTVLGIWHFARTPAEVEFPKSLHQEGRLPVAV